MLLVSWIDEYLITGNTKAVEKAKKELMERFNCDNCGELEEYAGCKIERKGFPLKFTQPVLIQSYTNKCELPTRTYKTTMQ